MPGLTLAAINPDNTPHGYNLTFAAPMLLFIAIAVILYMLFSRPHRRVPGRRISLAATSAAPSAEAAQAASVAGGLSLAPGGGTTESQYEPAGAHLVAAVSPEAPAAEPEAAEPEAAGAADSDGTGAGSDPADADEGTPGASE